MKWLRFILQNRCLRFSLKLETRSGNFYFTPQQHYHVDPIPLKPRKEHSKAFLCPIDVAAIKFIRTHRRDAPTHFLSN